MTQSRTDKWVQIFGVLCLFLTTHCGVKKDPVSPIKTAGPHIEWQPNPMLDNSKSASDKAANDQYPGKQNED